MPESTARELAFAPSLAPATRTILAARSLSVSIGGRLLLREVSLDIPEHRILALIGPSGAGKTTLLKTFNRLIDLVPGSRVRGEVSFAGRSIFAPEVDPDQLRRQIGMILQQPVVFPGSIATNVLFGLPRRERRAQPEERLEGALREASLWEEVKDRLREPAASLSTGQQQRLCLARALAVEPSVLLLDEPTSALDERSTAAIEATLRELAARRTVVLVTHNLAQAERIADRVACLCVRAGAGEVLACGPDTGAFDKELCREVVAELGCASARRE